MKLQLALLLLICTSTAVCQVGIGTTTPNAELEIEAVSGLPALELNPQVTPTGTATGQIAVIGDQLFMYDLSRSKWLTIETTLLNFGREENTDNRFLEYVGDIESTGAIMPFDGTIVYVSINSTDSSIDGASNPNKKIELWINNAAVPNNDTVGMESIDGEFELSANQFSTTIYNLDFNKDDFIRIRASAEGSGVRNATALLWVKWRR